MVNDPDRLADEPDPKSAHVSSVRIVGYSVTARMVITVVALRDASGVLHGASAWKPEVPHYASTERMPAMTDVSEQDLQRYRAEAEDTSDEPLSENATRPGVRRAKVLSVRLSDDEFEELTRYADAMDLPASALVRGWILDQLRAAEDSPVRTVERIAQELEQLRRQLAA